MAQVSHGSEYTALLPPWLIYSQVFILFNFIVNGIIFLISFSKSSLLIFGNATDILYIDFCTFQFY